MCEEITELGKPQRRWNTDKQVSIFNIIIFEILPILLMCLIAVGVGIPVGFLSFAIYNSIEKLHANHSIYTIVTSIHNATTSFRSSLYCKEWFHYDLRISLQILYSGIRSCFYCRTNCRQIEFIAVLKGVENQDAVKMEVRTNYGRFEWSNGSPLAVMKHR